MSRRNSKTETAEAITPEIRADIKSRINEYLSDADLKRYFPDNKDPNPIIKYNELANVKNIFELLPQDRTFKVILIERRPNIGHWVCILRRGDTIFYLDSYSNQQDGQLKHISSFWRKMLGQDEKLMTKLLKPKRLNGFKLKCNKNRLQSLASQSGTCGRWCILWITMCLDFKFDLDEFEDFIDLWKEKLNLSRDELVTHWVR